ncbi:MAG: carbohydrate ABC transporter permease [Proteobacteria bacterium]|nr:carbohydrate ABC transporter permease [Pseudomonadota bacterium]
MSLRESLVGRSRLRLPRLSTVATHGALWTAGAIVLVPFLWVLTAAFKTQIALLSGVIWFNPVLRNFNEILFSKTSDYIQDFLNSLLVASASTVIVLVVATLAAYSISRLAWPRWVIHGLLLWAVLFHMIPPITMVGTWYVMFRSVGLDNTHLGLILAHIALNLPIGLWLLTIFVREVPRELEEAAFIDGASTPVVIWRVVVPLIRPGLAAAGILVFIFSWNEFAVALNLTAKQTATVPVAIAKYAQEFEIRYTEMAASAVLSIIPAFILLLVGQRAIVRGLTAGALK